SFIVRITQADALALTICGISSDSTIVANNNISIDGAGVSGNPISYTLDMSADAQNYTATIVPETGVSGSCRITFTVVSPTGMTAISAFNLDVNGVPLIGSISDQTTNENIAINSIALTVMDAGSTSCSFSISMSSSDQSLIPDEYLLSACQQDQYSIVVTPALNQTGSVTISITITDNGGLSASTSFNLTVTDVDDNIYMWANNQAADVVLGQSDFISNTSGTTNNSFNRPVCVSVDPTTGKVFVGDFINNRVLRFSSSAAAINGSAAEAVFGQADFVSSLANRGGSTASNTFSSPVSTFVDSFGRLWVADRDNHRILRFDNASSKNSGSNADGVIGQSDFISYTSDITQNKLYSPNGIWVDPAGTLWVSDTNNNRILRFDNVSTKINGANADGVLGQSDFVSNSPGTSQNGLQSPIFIFGDNANTIFVADSDNNRIIRFNNARLKANGANGDGVIGQSDFVSSGSGSTSTKIDLPRGLAMDTTGRLYIGGRANNRVLIFNDAINKTNGAAMDNVLGQPNFTSNTLNNGGISNRSLNTPYFLFFDVNENYLWVPDFDNHRVLRYSMMIKNAPVIELISDLTMDEDTISNAISFTVTDINEQALTITYLSSNESIISSTGILFDGPQVSSNGSTYTVSATSVETTVTLTITPETNQSGSSFITITVTDPNGMTATSSFSVSVSAVNDAPEISSIANQSIGGETSVSITFTASDPESAACGLDITLSSSNQVLLPNANLTYSCDANNYTINASRDSNKFGSTIISVLVSDGSATSEKQFTITTISAISFSPLTYTSTESGGIITITATLSHASNENISTDYTVTGGSAVSGDDYMSGSGTLNILAGATAKVFTITIIDDSLDEDSETVILGFSNFVNVTETTEAGSSYTLTILDNESPPTISWMPASSTVSESSGSVQLTATLSIMSGLSSNVEYTVGGSASNGADYTLANGTLTIPAGSASTNITIILGDDIIDENNETVFVQMIAYTNTSAGSSTRYTLTITDDDNPPLISFSPMTSTSVENSGIIPITATLSQASAKIINADYIVTGGTATSGSDYTLNSGTLTFVAGSTAKVFTIALMDDSLDEDSEIVILGFSNFVNVTETTGAGSSYTLTIDDNDNAPTIAWTASTYNVSEDSDSMLITATLSSVSAKNIAVDYTVADISAINTVDYTLTDGMLTIPAGSSNTTITVLINDDSIFEPTESFSLNMAAYTNVSAGGITVTTIDIADNDTGPTISWSPFSSTVSENSGSVQLTANLSSISGIAASIDYTVSGT
ncbi:hypothetical protein MHK_005502, partial [Candidatus Magnetomorum sp. HK-1]